MTFGQTLHLGFGFVAGRTNGLQIVQGMVVSGHSMVHLGCNHQTTDRTNTAAEAVSPEDQKSPGTPIACHPAPAFGRLPRHLNTPINRGPPLRWPDREDRIPTVFDHMTTTESPAGLLFFGLKSRPTTNGLRPCSPEVRTLSWVRTFTPYIEDALKERPTEVPGNSYRLTNLLTYDGLKGRLTLLSC